MVSEDYVSFENAKLLKEKGFDEKCSHYWQDEISEYSIPKEIHKWTDSALANTEISDSERFSAPTLQMVMKWLREVKKLNCIVDVSFNQKRNGESEYYFCVWENKPPYELIRESTTFSIYEEAAEAAIKYCLENLI